MDATVAKLQEVNRLALTQLAALRSKSDEEKITLEQKYKTMLEEERIKEKVRILGLCCRGCTNVHFDFFAGTS